MCTLASTCTLHSSAPTSARAPCTPRRQACSAALARPPGASGRCRWCAGSCTHSAVPAVRRRQGSGSACGQQRGTHLRQVVASEHWVQWVGHLQEQQGQHLNKWDRTLTCNAAHATAMQLPLSERGRRSAATLGGLLLFEEVTRTACTCQRRRLPSSNPPSTCREGQAGSTRASCRWMLAMSNALSTLPISSERGRSSQADCCQPRLPTVPTLTPSCRLPGCRTHSVHTVAFPSALHDSHFSVLQSTHWPPAVTANPALHSMQAPLASQRWHWPSC